MAQKLLTKEIAVDEWELINHALYVKLMLEMSDGTVSSARINKEHFIIRTKDVSTYAVCMDGTPPAYNLDPGSGAGSKSWIVNLEVRPFEILKQHIRKLNLYIYDSCCSYF